MASTYLTRTFQSGGNRKKGTMSMWVRRTKVMTGVQQILFQTYVSTYTFCPFDTSDRLHFQDGSGGEKTTTMKFQDTGSYYHIVIAIDTDLATADDRYKIYVNGQRITDFDNSTNPSQGYEGEWNKAQLMNIGRHHSSGTYFMGIMSHIHFCDGYQYQASDFGETDTTTGQWKIKTNPNVQYGTTGFHILKDNNVVTDQSSNSNDWTAYGTLTKTQCNPSNVFCTINSDTHSARQLNINTGSLKKANTPTSNAWRSVYGTLAAISGKYYFEMKIDQIESSDINNFWVGIVNADEQKFAANNGKFYEEGQGYGYHAKTGNSGNNNQTFSFGNSCTTGDIIGVAMDLDNAKLYFSKNGTWQNSGVPTSGSTGTGAMIIAANTMYVPAFSQYYGNEQFSVNFGNGYFGTTAVATNSGNGYQDADGNGIMNYSVPTGYRCLCTKGLNQ